MVTVGSYEAKTHLPRLIARVAKGEQITITKHGVPVAKLVPVDAAASKSRAEVIEELRRFRAGRTLGGISIRELIEDGRRF
ncbi:MAG: type II toxin-antitoxin system prevent-host-death family antitoxin [Bryobacterales bacterium]|nr:type II toxin-antitoxin system prevent-host-death family antitoxin [Bryobacterales bacterium]